VLGRSRRLKEAPRPVCVRWIYRGTERYAPSRVASPLPPLCQSPYMAADLSTFPLHLSQMRRAITSWLQNARVRHMQRRYPTDLTTRGGLWSWSSTASRRLHPSKLHGSGSAKPVSKRVRLRGCAGGTALAAPLPPLGLAEAMADHWAAGPKGRQLHDPQSHLHRSPDWQRLLSVAIAQGLQIRFFEISLHGRIVAHIGQAQTAATESAAENTCAGKFGQRP